jgi:pseudaminic acid cytidylyltransferase
MNVCVIPARGGSKRIPRKNIKLFGGKPMLVWSIEAAQASGCFDLILVTTDCQEIADTALQHGATVPFLRPACLSDDFTGTTAVVLHALDWMESQICEPALVCCLYATAPFVRPSDISEGLRLLKDTDDDQFVLTATRYSFPIQRALRIDPFTNTTYMLSPGDFSRRSQDLEETYHDAGQFYWARSQAWRNTVNIFSGARMLLLPHWRVQDIDTPDDWHRAEFVHSLLQSNVNN